MKLRTPSRANAAFFERPAWQSYGFAAAMMAIALLTRWLMDAYTGNATPLALMYVAVALSVWFGGWKPAVTVAIVGYVASLWWFVPPRHSFKLWDALGIVRSALYFLSCSITIYLSQLLRREREKQAFSEARATAILENMRESFCSVDRQWRITALNQGAERCFGLPRERVLQRSFWDVLPKTLGTPTETDLRRALQAGICVHFETNAFVIGSWHAVTAAPVFGGLSIFFEDITALRSQVNELERLVDDRTAALQRLVAELESFSYTLVHDMRAPLRAISGFADVLALDHAPQLDASGRDYIDRIQKSAARMDQLIVDILDYSHLSQRKPELTNIELDSLLRELIAADAQLTAEKVDVAITGELPAVRANGALLAQCFSNLLHNAAKFVTPGVKPRIRISGATVAGSAVIEICDNGIGIAPEATARIFEPFRREHPQYDGTGIGLAIVRKVVEQLGGNVGVESQLGRGSRFWVKLQLPPSAPAPAARRVTERILV
jgi:PAS domain S-box-containing protein